jgi:NADH-quinone oxidoreductase subunit E
MIQKSFRNVAPWQKGIEAATSRFGKTRTSLLSSLEAIQDCLNYIPEEAASYLAEIYNLPLAEINSIMSFYSMFTTEKKGKYVIRICDSLSCHINQKDNLQKYIWGILNIKSGETTPDKKFFLEIVDCLGSCDEAPAMMVNNITLLGANQEY